MSDTPGTNRELPIGTVVFLRTDIEGSMDLVRALGATYDELNEAHRRIVREAVARNAGDVVRTEGDAFFVAFTSVRDAATAAAEIQAAMAAHAWPEGHAFRLRIGLHAGVAYSAGDDYGGFEVNRAARIASAGWGGQIVLSDPVRALIGPDLPPGSVLRDIGRHRLKGLVEPEHLFQLDVAGLPTEFPALPSSIDPSDRLPGRVTTFIGREQELETLGRLLATTRLLTLTGPGGSGKTTLALELARRHAADLEDGAWFVDLQAVRDPDLVRAEIARGIGLLDGSAGTAADRLDTYASDRALLVVIDNFEQVIGAAAAIGEFLAASQRSKAIVTSRVPLKLRAEQEFAVRPMRVEPSDEDGNGEAVRLFIDRARTVRPDLAPIGADVEAIRETCRLVDGLPLAIELCAARAASLPLSLIRDRVLAHQPLPGSGPRDLPDRQRTIDLTVAWSYDLLDAPLQRLFARLAVFEESFDHAQAEPVCGTAEDLGVDVLDGLVRLAEHSLLTRVDDAVGGVRFGWLETIRSHASQRLHESGDGPSVLARYARAYADLASEAAQSFPGSDQARWIDRLEADDANLRAATRHAIETSDTETALRLAGSLWRFWLETGRLFEGRELIDRALSVPGADAPTTLRVRALDAAAGIAYWSGDVSRAGTLYEQELKLAQRIGDRAGEALAWFDLFYTREYANDLEGAGAARAAAETIMRELGDEFGLGRMKTSGMLITLARGTHDPGSVLLDVEAQAAELESWDDRWLKRLAPGLRGYACLLRGEYRTALAWFVRAMRENLGLRERADTALTLQFAVVVAPMVGHPDVAATVHGAAQAAFEQLGIVPPASYKEFGGTDPLPLIREALGVEGYDAAVDRGRRLSLEEVTHLVESIAGPVG